MTQTEGFSSRWISGWISDFSSIPRTEPWPSITLDQCLMADLIEAFDKARIAGYNGIILWGLLAGRSWNPYLPDTVSDERKQQVLHLMQQARARGLHVIMGLGLYSWGFEAIIAQHPEVDSGSPTTMCGTRPASWEWMKRVVVFVMKEYDPDGVSMQSSDQGRCPCDACQEMGSLEYHAAINDQVASYIRSCWPEKKIGISTWGMDLGNPEELPFVQKMTAHVDVLNDFNNSSARRGRENRKALIAGLKCAFGTEQGFWFDPPPFWNRLKWFLPISLRNIPYWNDLFADGGDAIERFILPLNNPSAEVGFLFDGWTLQDLQRDPETTLSEALEVVFEPRTVAARQVLLEVWKTGENGYLDNIAHPGEARALTSNAVHYTHAHPSEYLANRPEYLLLMKPESLPQYQKSLRNCLKQVQAVRGELGNAGKGVRLERSIRFALGDIERVMASRQ